MKALVVKDADQYPMKPLIIRMLHGATAILFVVSILSGYRAFDIAWSGVGLINRETYYAAHQTSGIVLLILLPLTIVARLFFLMSGKSEKAPLKPLWFRSAVVVGHILILSLGLMIAVSGWDGAMRGGIEISLFGVMEWPSPFSATGPEDSIRLYKFHKLLLTPFLVILGLHTLASIVHDLVLKDGLLRSMFWRRAQNEEA